MTTRIQMAVTLTLLASTLALVERAGAQQVQPKSPARQPSGQRPSTAKQGKAPAKQPPVNSADATMKKEILNSSRWRRAMFELNEWLSAQPYYDGKQVEKIKADLAAQVARMPASDLEFMLEDMEAKLQILQSSEARDAGAWIAHYLAIRTKKRREEILKSIPNFATMTAAQLAAEIAKIERRRAVIADEQAEFDQTRGEQVDATLAANRAAQQAYYRDQAQADAAAYYSPYRSQPSVQVSHEPLYNAGPSYSVGPHGGIYQSFGPNF